MNHSQKRWILLLLVLAAIVAGGCKKEVPSGSDSISKEVSTPARRTLAAPIASPDSIDPALVPPPLDPDEAKLFVQSVKDIYFGYDRYDLRPSAKDIIVADAAFLQAHPSIRFTIEGHCDERHSTEFTIALGENIANSVREALVKAGVDPNRIKTISYGKQKPFCTEHNERCWQKNRRAHFVYGR